VAGAESCTSNLAPFGSGIVLIEAQKSQSIQRLSHTQQARNNFRVRALCTNPTK
jgi:hypothetical protein